MCLQPERRAVPAQAGISARSEASCLVVWGSGDPFFAPAGAHAFRDDAPDAEIHLFDTGHFALETDGPEIAALIRDFLGRKGG